MILVDVFNKWILPFVAYLNEEVTVAPLQVHLDYS